MWNLFPYFYNANFNYCFMSNQELNYLCAELERDSYIGLTPILKFATLAFPIQGGLFVFVMGSYRLLTLLFRLWIKRTPPKFQYLRQVSVSDDLPVSTNDLPTERIFCLITHRGICRERKVWGLKRSI